MADYTVGEFGSSLERVAASLNVILEKLGQCSQDVVLESSEGRTAICGGPVIITGVCVSVERGTFTVGDLTETVGALLDWVQDVATKLSTFSPSATLDGPPWPGADDSSA